MQQGASSAAVNPKPRRWFAPRFSLRMLFIVVTAAGVGAAVWWRWPITTVATEEVGNGLFRLEETWTYHRGFRGELIKHGVHRKTLNGEVELEEYYREGVLHGLYRESSPPYGIRGEVAGEYFAGKRHGTWNYTPEKGAHIGKGWESPLTVNWPDLESYKAEEHWNHGRRDGMFQWWNEAGKLCFCYEFKDDRLIVPQGNQSSYLLRRIADGQLTDTRVQQALVQRYDLFCHDWPLHSVMEGIAQKNGLRFAFRSRRIAVPPQLISESAWYHPLFDNRESPFTEQWLKAVPTLRGKYLLCDAHIRVDVRNGPLHAGLEAMLAPLGLMLDYRNGILCIVDAGSPYDWEAATGVSQLHPPPESALAAKLDKVAKLMALGTLRRVLGNLATVQEIPIEIDFSKEELAAREYLDGWLDLPEGSYTVPVEQAAAVKYSDEPPTKPLTLRELLAILLDQANLHCHEKNGVLMIEAPPR